MVDSVSIILKESGGDYRGDAAQEDGGYEKEAGNNPRFATKGGTSTAHDEGASVSRGAYMLVPGPPLTSPSQSSPTVPSRCWPQRVCEGDRVRSRPSRARRRKDSAKLSLPRACSSLPMLLTDRSVSGLSRPRVRSHPSRARIKVGLGEGELALPLQQPAQVADRRER